MKKLSETAAKTDLETRVCIRCKVCKLITDFTRDRHKKSGYTPSCKVCNASRSRNYRKNNPDKVKESAKKYVSHNHEKEKLRYKTYRKSNLEKDAANSAKRRFSKDNATPMWLTKSQKQEILFFYTLAKDCETVSGGKYQVDHIVPLKGDNVCGLHVPWNLQVLPADINMSKGNRYEET